MAAIHISQLAERTGLPATTLRYYESRGLLSADRDRSGSRIYEDDVIERLSFISAAKHLGLSLTEIRELLGVRDGEFPTAQRSELRRRLITRLEDVERRVQELKKLDDSLRHALKLLDT